MDNSEINFTTPQRDLALSAEVRDLLNARNILTCRTKSKVISALGSGNVTKREKNSYFRDKTVDEILNSETAYLEQLEKVMTFFMQPIRDNEWLGEDDFSSLFGNIEILYKLNGELVAKLKENPEAVGKAFLHLSPFFKHYSVYALNYKKALAVLQSIEKMKNLQAFISSQESRPEVQNKLSALLIVPIQRIPRYRLLIGQLLEFTPPYFPEHAVLKQCLKSIEETIDHLDSLLKAEEEGMELIEVQKYLKNKHPSIIKPGRSILKQGLMKKMSLKRTSGSYCYLILFNDILLECKPLKEQINIPDSLRCTNQMTLSKCSVEEISKTGIIKLTSMYQDYLYYCDSSSCAAEWANSLAEAIAVAKENRSTLQKRSSTSLSIKKLIKCDGEFRNSIRIKRLQTQRKRLSKDSAHNRRQKRRQPNIVPLLRLQEKAKENIPQQTVSPSRRIWDFFNSLKNVVKTAFNLRQN